MQIAGQSIRIKSHVVRNEFNSGGALQKLLLRYFQFAMTQISQCAACNRLHDLEEWLARWLLMIRDRMASDKFMLTHEFLAQMLGTRRSSATLAAGTLRGAGPIKYHRGQIHILNRGELQNVSCEMLPRYYRKQAVAIALSEGRKSGAQIPKKEKIGPGVCRQLLSV